MSRPEYSSSVVLSLLVGTSQLVLSHVGSSSVIVRDAIEAHPPTDAEFVISVDGVVRNSKVHLPNGISAGERRVEYV